MRSIAVSLGSAPRSRNDRIAPVHVPGRLALLGSRVESMGSRAKARIHSAHQLENWRIHTAATEKQYGSSLLLRAAGSAVLHQRWCTAWPMKQLVGRTPGSILSRRHASLGTHLGSEDMKVESRENACLSRRATRQPRYFAMPIAGISFKVPTARGSTATSRVRPRSREFGRNYNAPTHRTSSADS